ncbi:hypothetical protein UMZ34_17960 [Halopseudomonas pachastrellae]|nr:hypothetical protein UMZ34_17960 [Halopseudomonas pachastrellae]
MDQVADDVRRRAAWHPRRWRTGAGLGADADRGVANAAGLRQALTRVQPKVMARDEL